MKFNKNTFVMSKTFNNNIYELKRFLYMDFFFRFYLFSFVSIRLNEK